MTTLEDLAKAQITHLQQQRTAYVDQVNQLMTAIANIDKVLAEGQSLFSEHNDKKSCQLKSSSPHSAKATPAHAGTGRSRKATH